MPRESTNLKLKLYNALTDATELAKDWFNDIFDYSNSNWVKIDTAYKELKDTFNNYPLNDGTRANGTWDININGNAKTADAATDSTNSTNAKNATNDSTGQQIDSTYIKDVTSNDGKLIITKGNGDTSTADVSAPAGYVITERIPYPESEDKLWLHIGNIKNTFDNDVIVFRIRVGGGGVSTIESTTTNYGYSIVIENVVVDYAQRDSADLSTTYGCHSYTLDVGGVSVASQTSTLDNEGNPYENASIIIIPTSGGNKTSNASVWIHNDFEGITPDSLEEDTTGGGVSVYISVELANKNSWEFVMEYESALPDSTTKIIPGYEGIIITDDRTANNGQVGVVQIGDGINVTDSGVISVNTASVSEKGLVKIGSNISVDTDGTISVGTYAGATTAGGTANSVNGFTFAAQTTDPGEGSALETGKILFVYE